MDEALLKALRILAFYKTEKPDYEHLYRKICRWYSREFSTSLLDAYKLPEEEVLKTWFEDRYEKLKADSDKIEQAPPPEHQEGDEEGAPVVVDTPWEAEKRELMGELIVGGESLEDIRNKEDDEWEKQMLKEIEEEERVAAEKRKTKKSAKPSKDPKPSQVSQKPNLLEQEINKVVKVESDPVFEED